MANTTVALLEVGHTGYIVDSSGDASHVTSRQRCCAGRIATRARLMCCEPSAATIPSVVWSSIEQKVFRSRQQHGFGQVDRETPPNVRTLDHPG